MHRNRRRFVPFRRGIVKFAFLMQLGLTRGQSQALDNSSWNWNVLGTVVGPKVTLFSTLMTSQHGKRELFRSAVIKHHSNKGVLKTIAFHTDDSCIAKSLVTVTVDAFDASMVETLSQLGRFHIKAQGEPEYPQQRTPITLICAKEPIPIGIDVMEEYEEYIALVLTDGRYDKTPKMKWCNEDRFQAEGWDLGKSILCENLESWASKWFDRNEWEVSFNIEADTWPDSAWQRACLYLEYSKPGTAIYCSGKTEGNWPMAAVAQVTKKTQGCQFVYRCNISTHFRAMFNIVQEADNSEWFAINSSGATNFGHSEGDQVTKLSQQLSQLMKEKRRSELEIENLKITTKILSTHNQELLKHVSNFACAEDFERKDGKRRDIKFSPADQEKPENVDPEADIEEEAMMIKTIIQNVVKPRSGTTLNMHNDLRMKLDAAKTGRLQTKVSPESPLGPDLDELPESKKGAPPVVTLQGLEGAVIRGHGATAGIRTSSSSSNSSDITMEERTRQVPTIASGRALVRRAGVVNAPGKLLPAGVGVPGEENQRKSGTISLNVSPIRFLRSMTLSSRTLRLEMPPRCHWGHQPPAKVQ